MSSEQRGKVIFGTVCLVGLAGGTIYICRDGFSWWALLTGLLALGALGFIIESLQEGKPSTTARSTSSGSSGAQGLAALFNSMDGQGAENFAKLLNQMGEPATPAADKSKDEPPPGTGLLAAALGASLVAGASTETLAPGQFRVVEVETLWSGSMNVKMQSDLGAGPEGVLHLAVMCFNEGGKDVLQGQDKDENWVNLTDVKQPAVLYVPRETLQYLKQQPRLWQRVQHSTAG